VIYAWHPGTMGGPALADILLGKANPSGKLPVTFPKVVGQIPMHYNHKNCGRPVDPKDWVQMDKIPVKAFQTSLGNTSHYIDAGYEPLYPFGYGLSYTTYEYSNLKLNKTKVQNDENLEITFTLKNTGEVAGEEVAQLYVRDLAGNVTRPVRELKGFKRVALAAGEEQKVTITLAIDDLAFTNEDMKQVVEPGDFQIWVGGDSRATLSETFTVEK